MTTWCADCELNLGAVIRPDGSQASACNEADVEDVNRAFEDDEAAGLDNTEWLARFKACREGTPVELDMFDRPVRR